MRNTHDRLGLGPDHAALPARLLVTVLLVCLGACVPWMERYLRIDAPAAKYFRNSCYGSFGPPSIVYFPYHGIFISLDITDWVSLGLHLPPGTTAQLDSATVHISGMTDSGPIDATFPIKAADPGSLGAGTPRAFTERTHYPWYFFLSETDGQPLRLIPVPSGLLRGAVELPPMTINGEHYEPQTLHFERRTYGEITTVNC